MSDEDLEGANDIDHWNGSVRLPLVDDLCALNEDNEVVLLALEVDLDFLCFSFDHVDRFLWCGLEELARAGVTDRWSIVGIVSER